MKLWQKDNSIQNEITHKIEKFTVGNDRTFDLKLAEHDVVGSLAHTQMLESIQLLSNEDYLQIKNGLNTILSEIKAGKFVIEEGVEDVHSQIELMLTRTIGEAGKKIHSGRSRNDQVLLDIKLYTRSELKQTAENVLNLFNLLIDLSNTHKDKLLPGYTHLQLAMPSSFGLWFGAYAESLVDDMELLVAAYKVANKNPLGSGAGYGSSFPLNRKMTTQLLGFDNLNWNVVYAQMSRGKTEKIAAMALSSIAATLAKFSMDVCLYMNQNFGFISFPAEFTTGSSIMPHKKNPDVFELVRAHCNRIQALPNELAMMLTNLPSGYHRDLQLTKETLFPAFEQLNNCISIIEIMLTGIDVKNNILENDKFVHLFSVEEVNKLVLQGVPFREAYKIVGKQIEENSFKPTTTVNHIHEGSIGNPCNAEICEMMRLVSEHII